jgi:hypothetical protein
MPAYGYDPNDLREMRETGRDPHSAPDVWYDYTNQAWVTNGVYKRCGHPESMNCGCYGRAHRGEKPAQSIIEQYATAQGQNTARKPSVMTLMSDQDLRNIVAAETTAADQCNAALDEWQHRHPPERITDDFSLATTPGGEQFAVSDVKWFQITDIVDSVERANEICARNSHVAVIGEKDGLVYIAEIAPLFRKGHK